MFVCMYVLFPFYSNASVCSRAHQQTYIHNSCYSHSIPTQVCMYAKNCRRIDLYACMYMCMYVCMCMCVCVYVCICMCVCARGEVAYAQLPAKQKQAAEQISKHTYTIHVPIHTQLMFPYIHNSCSHTYTTHVPIGSATVASSLSPTQQQLQRHCLPRVCPLSLDVLDLTMYSSSRSNICIHIHMHACIHIPM
jgi:hypothetical protein